MTFPCISFNVGHKSHGICLKCDRRDFNEVCILCRLLILPTVRRL